MPPKTRTTGNLALASFGDIFNVNTAQADSERAIETPLNELHPPEFHPFLVMDDEAMYRLAASIKEEGVREPGLARPRTDGGYELLCGNRRKRGCELAGLATMPVIIRELDDEKAAFAMLGNLDQREKILPSEKAWAYKVMMDALNHNGVKGERHSYQIMEERTGVKKSQLFRFIALTGLIVTLIDKVDAKQLAFNPAVELSNLSIAEQTAVAEAMVVYQVKPSYSQAIRLKKLKQDGKLTLKDIDKILSENKKPPKGEATGSARYRRFFPPSYSPKQIDTIIVELLKDWKARAAV